MDRSDRRSRSSRVPAGRLERLARVGWLAGEIALGGAAEGLRRMGGADPSGNSLLLTGANGRRLAKRLANLRGAAMKLGQLLSIEADDLVTPEVAAALAVLRADGDPMPRAQLRNVLSRGLGKGWQERFARFDWDPIAAASIGQVHAASTRDGRELALKIQYPGVARSIDSDVDNLAAILRLARILPGDVDFTPIIDEAKRQLRREVDYDIEAAQLRRYGDLLEGDPEVVVPGVHADFSTKRILAMDRLHGVPLEDLCGPEHSQTRRDEAASLLMRIVLRELFEFGYMQSDPNFANYLLLPDGRIALLDLGAGSEIDAGLARGYAAMFRAGMANDRDAMEQVARDIGFLVDSDPIEHVDAMIGLIALATEPFLTPGRFDFGASDIPARAREASAALVFEHGFWRPPPPATLLLQRKFGGTFLLCMRLGGRVAARDLLEEALAGYARRDLESHPGAADSG
jgi:predicted unusual protein kinase regulating ubiquinone biosynthesis (AarF/ABC1/UbiB family)